IEDGIKAGGMGSAVLEFMADHGYSPKLQRIGIPDHFIEHGTAAQLYALCGLDEEGIKKVLKGEKWEKNARINGNGIKIQTVDEKAHLSN
ncbi:transketolase C-terminal domain-containing protein, partial [Bacteroides salyersiae]